MPSGIIETLCIRGVGWVVFPTLTAARRYQEAVTEDAVERTRASDR
jgi:hypothetical protein